MQVLASVAQSTPWLGPAAAADVASEASAALVAWLAVPVAVLLVAAVSSVDLVPDPYRAVVTRLGRTVRVSGPGLVLHVPVLERVLVVSLRVGHLTVVAPALTRDGVAVTVTCSVTHRIEDPGRVPRADPDPLSATASAVEEGVARAVSRVTLANLLADREHLEHAVGAEVSRTTRTWGVRVPAVSLGDVEARLTAELLHARGPLGGAEA